MFYSQFILSKNGPLATIWIAAHLHRKLRKHQIAETSIADSVHSILYPEVPIALRLSGHLLLGVVRIYSRKVNYLFHDCSEALIKIKQAIHTSAVNLPPGAEIAPYHSITLPESFDFDQLEAHLRSETAAQGGDRIEFEHLVTDRDLITLQNTTDDHGSSVSLFTLEERFAEAANSYAIFDLPIKGRTQESDLLKPVTLIAPLEEVAVHTVEEDVLPPLPIEEDMDLERMDIEMDKSSPENHGAGHLKVDKAVPFLNEDLEPQANAPEVGSWKFDSGICTLDRERTVEIPEVEKLRASSEVRGYELFFEYEEFDHQTKDTGDRYQNIGKCSKAGGKNTVLEETPILREEINHVELRESAPRRSPGAAINGSDMLGSILGGTTPQLEVVPTPMTARRNGRKRKHIFDDRVALSSTVMRKQLNSTGDICRTRRKAPSTEYEIWMSQSNNNLEKKFSSSSIPGLCAELKCVYDSVLHRKSSHPVKGSSYECGTSKPHRDQTRGRLTGVSFDTSRIEPGLSEPCKEIITLDAQIKDLSTPHESLSADSSRGTTGDITDDAQLGKPLSPVPLLPVDHAAAIIDERGLENITEQCEVADMEVYVQRTEVSKQRETENEAKGLSFLADAWETVGAVNEAAFEYEQMGRHLEDKSGWSSRTRAVANYLKEKLEKLEASRKLDEDETPRLTLGRLLTGRTRREAARMFFETLVLKTKDYLQVEQDACYFEIHLFGTQRLMKSVF